MDDIEDVQGYDWAYSGGIYDMVVKSKQKKGHSDDLKEVFGVL